MTNDPVLPNPSLPDPPPAPRSPQGSEHSRRPTGATPPPPPAGRVSEIFSTLQGEGLYVGQRQIFVRLAGCPWRCRYCDTPDSLTENNHPTLTVHDVLRKVRELQSSRDHAVVSLTGGEPLLQPDFLAALLPPLKDLGLRTYLETSATHPHLFRSIAPWCDVVAADLKLPSAIGRPFWAEHEEFLRIAGDRAFVKIVLTSQTTEDELETAVNLLSGLTPVPPVVLQPVTPISDLDARLQGGSPTAPSQVLPPSPARLVGFWDWVRQRVPVVKLVPQMHPIWGLP